MAYMQDEEIERGSRRFRQDVRIDGRDIPDLLFVLNELRRIGTIADYLALPDASMPSNHAKYDSDTKVLHFNRSTHGALDLIYSDGQRERRRSRFTVPHEIAHIVLGHDGGRYRGQSSEVFKRFSRDQRTAESEANRWASAFLAPMHILDRVAADTGRPLDVDTVSCLFDINAQAAAIRLETVSRVKERESGAPKLLPTSYANFLRGLQANGARIESLEIDDARKSKIALAKGFLGVHCPECGNFTLLKKNDIVKCVTCHPNHQ
jgi:Zn-dependent peptidase ImmA (M78 family)